MGALGIAFQPGMVSPSYNVYSFANHKLTARYYDQLCRIPVHVQELIRHSKGIWQSRLRLYPDAFREVWTPLPPEPEQSAICCFVDTETAKIQRLANSIESAIFRLKDYRSALIAAVVTGKFDVRQEGSVRSEP